MNQLYCLKTLFLVLLSILFIRLNAQNISGTIEHVSI